MPSKQSRDQLSPFPRSLVTLSAGQGYVEPFSMDAEGNGSSGDELSTPLPPSHIGFGTGLDFSTTPSKGAGSPSPRAHFLSRGLPLAHTCAPYAKWEQT